MPNSTNSANNARRALGIDPGLGTCGYGVISQYGSRLVCDTYGVIKTPTKISITQRLKCLYDELHIILDQYKPNVFAVEKLFFGRNVTTAEMVWEARGIILLYASELGLEPYELKPADVKMAVCGYGLAEKIQVQGMVAKILGLPKRPTPDDAADALAIAIAGMTVSNFDNSILRGL